MTEDDNLMGECLEEAFSAYSEVFPTDSKFGALLHGIVVDSCVKMAIAIYNKRYGGESGYEGDKAEETPDTPATSTQITQFKDLMDKADNEIREKVRDILLSMGYAGDVSMESILAEDMKKAITFLENKGKVL